MGNRYPVHRKPPANLSQSEQTNNGQRPDTVTNREELVAQGDPESRIYKEPPPADSSVFIIRFSCNDVEIQTSLYRNPIQRAGQPGGVRPLERRIALLPQRANNGKWEFFQPQN